MNKDTTGRRIKDTLKDAAMLYEKHIDSFTPDGAMPDLEKQNLERKNLFDGFVKNIKHADASLLVNEISTLLQSNRTLLQLAQQKRKQLTENIKAISKGKQALKGYGQLNRRAKAPKVMSFKE